MFSPERLTVKAGTTVTWINHDDIPHTVVSAGKFRSKTLDTDGTFSFTFTTAGSYPYFCSIHPKMTGKVVVQCEFVKKWIEQHPDHQDLLAGHEDQVGALAGEAFGEGAAQAGGGMGLRDGSRLGSAGRPSPRACRCC